VTKAHSHRSRRQLPAYLGYFTLGVRQAVLDKGELVSSMTIYAVLLIIFHSIYSVMPIEELGVASLTRSQLLWYFAITECIIVSGPGLAQFGQLIAEGRLTEMMQRPCNMVGVEVARLMGAHLAHAAFMFLFALLTLPLFFGASFPLPLPLVPLLCISVFLGILLFEFLTYTIGTIEILGPYSRPMSWIIGKFVFAFGGLFFPVSFFPPTLQQIVMITPFPATIFIPARFMLVPEYPTLLIGIAQQMIWCTVFLVVAVASQKQMLSVILERGE
jgi:ABC-2 type transport system permease protein